MGIVKSVAFGVTVSLLSCSTVLAQGPVVDSGRREVRARSSAAQGGQAVRTTRKNPGLMWAGIGVWGAGVTLEVLSWTALKREEAACVFGVYSYVCASESHTNWPLMGIGLGLAGGGIVMWTVGGQTVSVAPAVRFGTTHTAPSFGLTGRLGF